MIHFIQLFGPSNMSLGCYVIAVWESKGEGIQWSNLSELIRHSRFPIGWGLPLEGANEPVSEI